MRTEDLVASIFASFQWDCWKFALPFAKPLLKVNMAVVSHNHRDHLATNLPEKDVVLIPSRIEVPSCFANLRSLLRVDRYEQFGAVVFSLMDRRAISEFLRCPVKRPHAFWWVVSCLGVRVLFIGDLWAEDVETAEWFASKMFEKDLSLNGVLLPSYGGVKKHGAVAVRELGLNVENLAFWLKDVFHVTVGALPHPVEAKWADYNAVKLENLAGV